MGASQARAFRALEECTLVAACDIDRSKAEAFAKTYGIPKVYTDLATLLRDEAVDAVTIVTPDATHAPLAHQALTAGKHVLCEKPLATNHADALKMVAAARSAGVVNMVNFAYRQAAALYKAHALVQQGALGQVRHVEASYRQSWLVSKAWGDWRTEPTWLWRLSTAHGSSGVLGDIGVHILDLATFPAGNIKWVQCHLKTFPKAKDERIGDYTLDANDTALITAELEGGALATIHVSRWATGYGNTLSLHLHGDRGALRLNLDTSYDTLDVCLGDDVETMSWRTITARPVPTVYERFLKAIQSGKPGEPDFARGAAIQQIVDACFASAHAGQAVTL